MNDPVSVRDLFRSHWSDFARVNSSDRPWQMPLAASLSAGLPLCVGVWFGHVDYGLISTLGGLVFLYTPNTRLTRRMATLMACGFGMTACFALGVLAQQLPLSRAPTLAVLATLATMLTRYFRMPPPGNFFFVMAVITGMFTPTPLLQLPTAVGLMFLGAFLALLIAFAYSLVELRLRPPRDPPEPLGYAFDQIIYDAIVIGFSLGVALAVALALGLDRPYWVVVSCSAVLQGQTMRAVWTRQLQRILGTALGLGLALALLALPLDGWGIAALVALLTLIVETTIVRHYGFAAMFITPLTILMAEAAHPEAAASVLVLARLLDTAVGCMLGVAGAAFIHRPGPRAIVSAAMLRLADVVQEKTGGSDRETPP